MADYLTFDGMCEAAQQYANKTGETQYLFEVEETISGLAFSDSVGPSKEILRTLTPQEKE